jgi:hypothetical protein
MRFILSAAASLALTACAATTQSPTPAAPSVSAPEDSSRALRLLSAAGGQNAPTRAEIEREIGQADIARQDGAGVALTYRVPTCALLLLFAANERNEMRLREAHGSARRAGAAAPDLRHCAAEASTRRS